MAFEDPGLAKMLKRKRQSDDKGWNKQFESSSQATKKDRRSTHQRLSRTIRQRRQPETARDRGSRKFLTEAHLLWCASPSWLFSESSWPSACPCSTRTGNTETGAQSSSITQSGSQELHYGSYVAPPQPACFPPSSRTPVSSAASRPSPRSAPKPARFARSTAPSRLPASSSHPASHKPHQGPAPQPSPRRSRMSTPPHGSSTALLPRSGSRLSMEVCQSGRRG